MVWTSGTWSYDLDAQMLKRLYRQGQTKPVLVSYLVAKGTIDEDVRLLVDGKHKSQMGLLKALRERVNERASERLSAS